MEGESGNYESRKGCPKKNLQKQLVILPTIQGQPSTIVQSKLKAYAKALDVTVGYLLGIEDADGFDIAYNPVEVQLEVNAFDVVKQAYGKDAVELLQVFVQLNEIGQQKALEQINDLFEIKKYIK